LILNNGWRLEKEFAHLDYGYVTTSHVAQSKTVDWVFVVQSAAQSAVATDANQFYVSVSRGRKGVKIYTDSLELLRENVARVRERKMAMEMMQEQAGGKARAMSASALLGQQEQIEERAQAEVLRQVSEPKSPLSATPEIDRSADYLGTQRELDREAAEEAERMAKAREREEELEMVM
jgi:hypothetical protein